MVLVRFERTKEAASWRTIEAEVVWPQMRVLVEGCFSTTSWQCRVRVGERVGASWSELERVEASWNELRTSWESWKMTSLYLASHKSPQESTSDARVLTPHNHSFLSFSPPVINSAVTLVPCNVSPAVFLPKLCCLPVLSLSVEESNQPTRAAFWLFDISIIQSTTFCTTLSWIFCASSSQLSQSWLWFFSWAWSIIHANWVRFFNLWTSVNCWYWLPWPIFSNIKFSSWSFSYYCWPKKQKSSNNDPVVVTPASKGPKQTRASAPMLVSAGPVAPALPPAATCGVEPIIPLPSYATTVLDLFLTQLNTTIPPKHLLLGLIPQSSIQFVQILQQTSGILCVPWNQKLQLCL